MATTVVKFCMGICLVFIQIRSLICVSDQGKWSFTFDQRVQYITVSKSLYKDSKINIRVVCDGGLPDTDKPIKIGWVIRQAPCYEEYLDSEMMNEKDLEHYYKCPTDEMLVDSVYNAVRFLKSPEHEYGCSHHINLHSFHQPFEVKKTEAPDHLARNCQDLTETSFPIGNKIDAVSSDVKSTHEKLPKPEASSSRLQRPVRAAVTNSNEFAKPSKNEQTDIGKSSKNDQTSTTKNISDVVRADDKTIEIRITEGNGTNQMMTSSEMPLMVPSYEASVDQDGLFWLILHVHADNFEYEYNVTVDIEMKGNLGYLSAVDWPLLPFYAVMCAIYVIYAVVWLVISALQWRDLLRIQFWIGGLIFLGLVEKAVFYGEYQYINTTGQSIHGAILFAEILSCVKRTLARLLVIIVSLGFGIVKPRLGPVLHRIVGVGTLYLVLCVVEGCLRVLKPKNDPSNQTLMAEIPLAVLDSAICWWIFSSLVQTTRTLRLRRNVVKLTLYQHFTNTLIFAVLASIVYMSWSLYNHRLTNCITDWKELWVDEAYWHFLFSIVLLVIMVLWRPTNNNQRYAFTPLLDAVDEDDEDDYGTTNDAFGMKSRGAKNQSNDSSKSKEHRNSQTEDDLKWVEENIPSSFTDTALPSLLDSDEEIMTIRFERNKME